jgi:hypothetical protein
MRQAHGASCETGGAAQPVISNPTLLAQEFPPFCRGIVTPTAATLTNDGQVRLDYDNPRPDVVDVLLKARKP